MDGPMPERIESMTIPDEPIMVHQTPVVLVGGGVVDRDQLVLFARQYPVIAVDSGAVVLADMGLEPEAVVGDFDSVHGLSLDHIPLQIKITDQYSTDFEKALAVIKAPKIFGFGFLGKRLDHSLAALHVMAGSDHSDIVLIDPFDIAIMVKGQFDAQLPQGSRISLYAMMPQRFLASKGLVYPLDGLDIGIGQTLATSNQVVIPADEQAGDIAVSITPEGEHPYLLMIAPEGLNAVIG